jgi:hypothetical protein
MGQDARFAAASNKLFWEILWISHEGRLTLDIAITLRLALLFDEATRNHRPLRRGGSRAASIRPGLLQSETIAARSRGEDGGFCYFW